MKQLNVALGDNAYPIYVDPDGFSRVQDYIKAGTRVAIITNDVVAPLYLAKLKTYLPDSGVEVVILPDGETTKSFQHYQNVMGQLLAAGLNRSSVLIALGGGVIGDLTGFVAATLHRGCRYIQVPTTLLSQVDSSVGGKTGINHEVGKNLIGCFYQPEVVCIDPNTLKTLSPRQLRSGLAEVVKYGFLGDPDFLPWLNANRAEILALHSDCLEQMILHCCRIKAEVVAADEKEQGQRALLNFGHTFGHAIENNAGYGNWLHGEAVALGMLMASRLAVSQNRLSPEVYELLEELLGYFDLPVHLGDTQLSATQLTQAMLKDKKNLTATLRLVLPTKLGHCELIDWQDLAVIEQLWRDFGAQ